MNLNPAEAASTTAPSLSVDSPAELIDSTLPITLGVLVRPQQHIIRIDEKVSIRGLSIRRQLRMEFRASQEGDDWEPGLRVWLPIQIVNRGMQLDNFSCRSVAGQPLRRSTHLEHQDLLIAAITLRLQDCGVPTFVLGREQFSSEIEIRLVEKILELVAKIVTALPSEANKLRDDLLGDAFDLRDLGFEAVSRMLRLLSEDSVLRYLLDVAVTSYPIFVETVVGPNGCIGIEVEYDAPHVENAFAEALAKKDRKGIQSWMGRLRAASGLRPSNQCFFLGRAPSLCQNFHFRMDAPHGFYRNQSIFLVADFPSKAGLELEDFDPATATVLIPEAQELVVPDPNAPQMPHDIVSYVDMYIGRCRRREKRFFASITFFERPPGIIGVALATSLVVLGVLLVFGLFFRALVNPEKEAAFEVPALLVALPGVYALMMTPKQQDRGLTSRPITGFAGLAATGVISLLAALDLILTGACGDLIPWRHASWTFSAIAVGHTVWISLFLIQLAVGYVLFLHYRRAHVNFRREGLKMNWLNYAIIKLSGGSLSIFLDEDDQSENPKADSEEPS